MGLGFWFWLRSSIISIHLRIAGTFYKNCSLSRLTSNACATLVKVNNNMIYHHIFNSLRKSVQLQATASRCFFSFFLQTPKLQQLRVSVIFFKAIWKPNRERGTRQRARKSKLACEGLVCYYAVSIGNASHTYRKMSNCQPHNLLSKKYDTSNPVHLLLYYVECQDFNFVGKGFRGHQQH